jgi:hypothetical protein
MNKGSITGTDLEDNKDGIRGKDFKIGKRQNKRKRPGTRTKNERGTELKQEQHRTCLVVKFFLSYNLLVLGGGPTFLIKYDYLQTNWGIHDTTTFFKRFFFFLHRLCTSV